MIIKLVGICRVERKIRDPREKEEIDPAPVTPAQRAPRVESAVAAHAYICCPPRFPSIQFRIFVASSCLFRDDSDALAKRVLSYKPANQQKDHLSRSASRYPAEDKRVIEILGLTAVADVKEPILVPKNRDPKGNRQHPSATPPRSPSNQKLDVLVFLVDRAHQGRRRRQDLVHKDEDGLFWGELDTFTDDVDELTDRQVLSKAKQGERGLASRKARCVC